MWRSRNFPRVSPYPTVAPLDARDACQKRKARNTITRARSQHEVHHAQVESARLAARYPQFNRKTMCTRCMSKAQGPPCTAPSSAARPALQKRTGQVAVEQAARHCPPCTCAWGSTPINGMHIPPKKQNARNIVHNCSSVCNVFVTAVLALLESARLDVHLKCTGRFSLW